LSRDEIESDGHAPTRDALINGPDGRKVVYPLPRTKWDNWMRLARELEGRPATADDLAPRRLTRREYEHFLTLYAQSSDRTGTSLPSIRAV